MEIDTLKYCEYLTLNKFFGYLFGFSQILFTKRKGGSFDNLDNNIHDEIFYWSNIEALPRLSQISKNVQHCQIFDVCSTYGDIQVIFEPFLQEITKMFTKG